MNCGNFHHFISGLAGGFQSAPGGGGSPAGGVSRTCNRVGLKGKFFFPGICQASFSWSCTEGTSNPKIVYTGHFDRIEKKAAIDCDKDIPTLLNHTVECQPGVFFQNFVLAGLCWQEQWAVSRF